MNKLVKINDPLPPFEANEPIRYKIERARKRREAFAKDQDLPIPGKTDFYINGHGQMSYCPLIPPGGMGLPLKTNPWPFPVEDTPWIPHRFGDPMSVANDTLVWLKYSPGIEWSPI